MASRNYVIIIGAMKSGTTTLFDMLADHPAIAPANPKEPGFFAFDHVWSNGFDWFDTLFDFDPATHRYRLEGSTDYTKWPFAQGVWERMTANPDVSVKLLYIMRHPLRRLESHARHVQGARMELGREITPKADHGLDHGLSALNIAVSHYAMQLDAFAEARAAGNLHVLTLEGLKTDPDATMRAVYDFLDLNPPATAEVLKASNRAAGRTRSHPLWDKLARNRALVAAGKAVLPQTVRDRIRGAARQKIVAEGRFALDETEQAYLEALYAPDLRRLRDEYDVDTERLWGIDGSGRAIVG
ncbi:MAG: sulfotransferase domain-containing protein [Pseudomonadota bacterium]